MKGVQWYTLFYEAALASSKYIEVSVWNTYSNNTTHILSSYEARVLANEVRSKSVKNSSTSSQVSARIIGDAGLKLAVTRNT